MADIKNHKGLFHDEEERVMADADNCKRCDAPMRMRSIDRMSGEDGVVKVEIADFPVLMCERGHRRFIAGDFPARLLKEVTVSKVLLPSGKKKGFLFTKYRCGKCGEPLADAGETRPFEFSVALSDAPQFRVELTVPVYRCTACGAEQLRDREEIETLTPAALAQAFQGAELRPQM